MSRNPTASRAAVALALAAAGPPLSAPAMEDYFESPPVNYSDATPDNQLSRLAEAIGRGELELVGETSREVLESLLGALGVPVESQVLVFSKTSQQNSLIGPANPRSIFFSENCYVGWVPGGLIEVACYEPALGPVFYLVDAEVGSPASPAGGAHGRPAPEFIRDRSCLSCHTRTSAVDTPGVMVRSVHPAPDGQPVLRAGSFLTTAESPLEERWGGWYVTGQHGDARHMGNATVSETGDAVEFDREPGANLGSLDRFFDTTKYLRPTSDIVALMVLEHQTAVHNALTEANLRTRIASHRQRSLLREIGEEVPGGYSGSALAVAESQVEKVVELLLFCGEAQLPDGGVDGDVAFQDAFRSGRPICSDGRSLRDFQLLDRLFKYRCSYMVYSGAFDALDPELKSMVYRRLGAVLTSPDPGEKFAHLGDSERRRIVKILAETKDDLPAGWQRQPGGVATSGR